MKKFFSTVKFKIFISVTALITATVLLCVVLNSSFGQKYYFHQTQKNLSSVFSKVRSLYNSETLGEQERSRELEKLSANYNLHIMIFSEHTPIYSSLSKDSARFLNGENGENAEDEKPQGSGEQNRPPAPPPESTENDRSGKTGETKERVEEKEHTEEENIEKKKPFRFPAFENRKIIEENESYKIISNYIESIDAYNIELTGDFGDNMRIIIQSSAAAISETTSIFNRFFIFTGIFALLIAGFFAYLISKRITRPIYRLSAIAKSMSEMDFSKKYEGSTEDELGHLGNSINILSQKLEQTIGELKSANLKLLEDIDQKEKVDRQRKEFLSNVSHELKTPISIIEAYADGLLEMELDEESKKYYCEVIVDETEKMSVLIKKLMSLMRLETSVSPAEIESYDLAEQIKTVISVKTPLIKQYGAHVTFRQDGEDGFVVNADSFLIEEALVNYLMNALKYSSGNKDIIFSLENMDDKIRINVFNSGSHIADEDLENIWNSFYMADKARTRSNGSCGLGLSIVKAIADVHGCECGVYNTADGVVFYIEAKKA